MQETLEATQLSSGQESTLPAISPATDEDIIAYLRRSHKIGEIADLAEREALNIKLRSRILFLVGDKG